MGHIRIEPEQVQQLAAKLSQNADARRADVSTLSAQASPEAIWEGESAGSYRERYEAWRNAEQNLVEALSQLGQAVNQIAQNFAEIDRGGAAAFRG